MIIKEKIYIFYALEWAERFYLPAIKMCLSQAVDKLINIVNFSSNIL